MKQVIRSAKRYLPYLLILLTVAFFVYFFLTHPKLRHVLVTTNPSVLLVVGLLYGLLILNFAWVYDATLRLCQKRLPAKENVLLTCYSTIANFFGPLQSGPGVRAVYLKQKHGVKIRDYTLASFIYYAMYSVVSALFILIGSHHQWPLALALFVCVTGGSAGVVWFLNRRFARSKRGKVTLDLQPQLLAGLLLATVCQLLLVAVIYFVELRAVHTNASFLQALTYGGAANFALFVALTPGAIGFREAFLGFSQRLHHIGTTSILAASVIDRAVYVAFLGLLFLGILAVHANDKFRPAKTVAATETAE